MTKEERNQKQEKLIKECIAYFSNSGIINDEQSKIKLKQFVTQLVELEIGSFGHTLDDFELKVVDSYENNMTNGHFGRDGTNRSEFMFNLNQTYQYLNFPNKRMHVSGILRLCKTIFHEVEHCRQYEMVKTNVSSKDAIMFARDFALQDYLENGFYHDSRTLGNYDMYSLEKDANSVAYQRLEELHLPKHSDRAVEIGKMAAGQYSTLVGSMDGEKTYTISSRDKKRNYTITGERDDVSVEILDDAICARGRTDILISYPILQKEYNLDGSKKSADILLVNMQHELEEVKATNKLSDDEKRMVKKNIQHMYYELIYRAIEKAKPEELAKISQQFSQVEVCKIFNNMQAYFQGEMERKLGKTGAMASSTGNWKEQQDTRDRLVKYYEHKKESIGQIEGRLFQKENANLMQKDDNISLDTKERATETLSSDSKNDETWQKRLKLVRKIMSLYDISEADYQYERRAEDEQFNEEAVRKIVKPIEIDGRSVRVLPIGIKNLIADKTFYYDEEKGDNERHSEYTPRAIRNMINLLKAADNLTIDGGENFLLEFIQTPDVEYILGEMINGDTKLIGQLQERVEEAKRDNPAGICTHPKTKGELAKEASTLNTERTTPANFKSRFQDDIKKAGIDVGDVYQMAETIEKDMQQDRGNGLDR